MPFRSKAQRRFMYARHPGIAKRWEKHTPKGANLPEKAGARKAPKKDDRKSAVRDAIRHKLHAKTKCRST